MQDGCSPYSKQQLVKLTDQDRIGKASNEETAGHLSHSIFIEVKKPADYL